VPRWTGGESGIIRRLREFFQHPNVRHINVRDEESKEWVEKHLQPSIPIDLSPDIVCGMDLGFAAARKELGAPVFGLITRQQRADESDYRPMRALIERARGAGYRVRLIIAGNGPVGEEDYLDAQRHGLAVDEVAVAETIEENTAAITSCDALASMKFHGCVVGLMSGIPTIGMLTTDKFNSFYKMLGIERLLCHFRHAELPDHFGELAAPLPMEGIKRLRAESEAGMGRLRSAIQDLPRC
jgi:polysaccharide pyruvyl transferase WcaK-like protein